MSIESENIELLRARILDLEARLDYLYRHFGLTYAPDSGLPDANTAKMIELVRHNKKIEAIKLHRQLYNTDLATAKEAVEALERDNRY